MSFNLDYKNLFRFPGRVFLNKVIFVHSVLQELRDNQLKYYMYA